MCSVSLSVSVLLVRCPRSDVSDGVVERQLFEKNDGDGEGDGDDTGRRLEVSDVDLVAAESVAGW